MNILLLNPPAPNNKKYIREGRCTQEQGVWATLWPPVSLALTGAVLEQQGHRVQILDCPAGGRVWQDVRQTLERFAPLLVVWSTGTPSIQGDLELAAAIKEVRPEAVTAVFGTHVSVLDRQSLSRFADVDIVVRNEPEMTVSAAASALASGQGLEGVAGITFRNPQGRIVVNPSRPFLDDLDRLPFPAWHLLDLSPYMLPLKGRPFLIIAPQRGCPFQCSFCTCRTYYGSRLRRRSVDRVIAEIKYDLSRFHIRDFFFWAETFVVDRDYVTQLCRAMLAENLDIAWTCNSRVDIVDEQLLRLMARAGCWMISYGIESGDQQILDRAGKGIRIEQARQAVRLARRAGIKTAGHFILGLPGENEHTLKKTLSFSLGLKLDIAQFYAAVPFPGSALYDEALRQGWLCDCPFGDLRQDQAAMKLPTVSAETVDRYRARAYRRFYLRPAAWVDLLSIMEYKGLKGLISSLRSFLRWSE